MKLLLTSNGLSNDSVARGLAKLNGKPARQSKVAFIPTAANPIRDDKGWLIDDMYRIKAYGYGIDVVDIAVLPKSEWLPRVKEADILFAGGGDSFYLYHWMKKSGLAKELPHLLRKRVYAGISAGSIVTGPEMKARSLNLVYPEETSLQNAKGLGLVPFLFRPHLNSKHFYKVRAKYLKAIPESYPVYSTDDMTAISVDGKKLKVVGNGKHIILNGSD